MNIRIAIAALLCAFYLGNSHAEPMKVDGENCLIPDASYIHSGILNDRDRFFWVWCVTRFNRYWSRSLDPLDRTKDATFSVGGTGSSDPAFTVHWPVIGWGEAATAELERAATNAAANDTHRPPIPAWRVQSNGKSTTRPGYVISEGKRSSTAAAERVTVGVPCDCRNKIGRAVEGKSVYCVVPGVQTPLLGALCTPGEATASPATPPSPPVTPPVITPPATGPGTTNPTAPPTSGPGLTPGAGAGTSGGATRL